MPEGTELTLSLVLTAAGATVSAGLIFTLIQILKRLPGFGTWLDDKRETLAAFILSVILVAYAYLATTSQPNPGNVFAALVAWVGIAGLATKAHDVAPEPLRNALSGRPASSDPNP